MHRQSPPVSSVQNKTSSSARWIAPLFLHDITDRNELIFRRVRGILNKLTPEKFDKLCYDLLNVGIHNKTILKGIIILIFEKAIDEQKYSNLYARLCQRFRHEVPNFDEPTSNTTTFVRLLLSKCQEEFETRSKASSVYDKKNGPLSPSEQAAKQVAKRKMLGNIKFIGELGKLELVQEAILHKCIQQLLAKKKKVSLVDMGEDIECLCQIITTIGKRLDTPKAKNIMDQYFDRIFVLSESEELPSRIRFMLQDVLALRKHKWVPRRIQRENGPRSVTQMRWEMMGPMMPPLFPFFPSGMVPPGMMPNMPMPPFAANGGPMPWLNDSMLAGGIMPPSMDPKLTEFTDDTKDIFGKPVQKQPPASKYSGSASKLQAKPDLFEPHYMKSKGSSASKAAISALHMYNNPQMKTQNTHRTNMVADEKESTKIRSSAINRNNPWNVDPFMPHYKKQPAVFPVNDEAVKSDQAKVSKVPLSGLPHTSRSNGLNPYNNKSSNKDGEISLRPSSFLSKKDEKPKTTFAKVEDLPANMQQFTNLTINDKTNKTKKTGLTKADIDQKIVAMIGQYRHDADIEKVCNELQSLATNLKYSKMVAKQFLHFSTNQEEKDWEMLANICVECGKKSIISEDTFLNTFTQLFDNAKVMEKATGKEFISTFAAIFIHNDLMSLTSFVEHFQDGRHYPIVLLCFAYMCEKNGREWLENIYKQSKIDLRLTFPKDSRSDDNVLKTVEEKNLTFLFPHLCLKEELLNLIKQGKPEDSLISWVENNVANKVEKKLLIHMIVICAVTIATQETFSNSDLTQKPDKELQEKEKDILEGLKNLLKNNIGSDATLQLEAIYALQIFCCEKSFPKEMLLRLFILFYNLEIVEEDVFLKWKEDINDLYPGKGNSLFQVNNWLQWLETADEEDEEEDEEEG